MLNETPHTDAILQREREELLAEYAALSAALARSEEELKDYKFVLGNRRDHRYVDVSPDADLPSRILTGYIEDGLTESYPPELGEMMNKWQGERNAILRRAIDQLTRSESAEATIADLTSRLATAEKALGEWKEMALRLDAKVIDEQRDHVKTCGYHDKAKARAEAAESALTTTQQQLAAVMEREERNELALDCLAGLAKLITNDDGVDPEAFHLELTREEANLIKEVARQQGWMPGAAPVSEPEHRCRHGILWGHCPDCPTTEEIEQNEKDQAEKQKRHRGLSTESIRAAARPDAEKETK